MHSSLLYIYRLITHKMVLNCPRNFMESYVLQKLTKNSSRNFATCRIPKFSHNLATFARRIFALHFPISGLARQNMSPQFLCVKEPAENGE